MNASLSRRRFFHLAGLAALAFPLRGLAALDTSGGDEIVILNDIHLTGIPEEKIPGNAKDDDDHLRAAVQQILALPKKPAAVIINGDLALSIGTDLTTRWSANSSPLCVTPVSPSTSPSAIMTCGQSSIRHSRR